MQQTVEGEVRFPEIHLRTVRFAFSAQADNATSLKFAARFAILCKFVESRSGSFDA
jgi:hypothetical protein